jgi:hypothetical protein
MTRQRDTQVWRVPAPAWKTVICRLMRTALNRRRDIERRPDRGLSVPRFAS